MAKQQQNTSTRVKQPPNQQVDRKGNKIRKSQEYTIFNQEFSKSFETSRGQPTPQPQQPSNRSTNRPSHRRKPSKSKLELETPRRQYMDYLI